MQKSIIVCGNRNEGLNSMLKEGWKVHSMCPMPSSCSVSTAIAGGSFQSDRFREEKFEPQCLVILERD